MRGDRRGNTAVEFALVLPLYLLLMMAIIEASRMMWTFQAMQLAGDQTARCIAIGSGACSAPGNFAATAAVKYGAIDQLPTGVVFDTQTSTSAPVRCILPSGNKAIRVSLTMTFKSMAPMLSKMLPSTLTTTSCYPLTGS